MFNINIYCTGKCLGMILFCFLAWLQGKMCIRLSLRIHFCKIVLFLWECLSCWDMTHFRKYPWNYQFNQILMLKGLCAYSPQCQVWLQIRDSHEAESTFCFIFDKADQSVATVVSFRKFIFQGLTQTSADIKLQTKLDIHWEVWFYNVPFSFVLSGIVLFTFLLCYTFLSVFFYWFYCSDRN